MARVEPVGAFGAGRLLPVLVCDRCEHTEDVSPCFDPWGRFYGEYLCGDCESGQEGPSFEDSMCAAYPLLDGTERY